MQIHKSAVYQYPINLLVNYSRIRLKKLLCLKAYETWPKCVFSKFFFFFFFFPWTDMPFFFPWTDMPFESATTLVQYEIRNLIFGWKRYKTEHRVEEIRCPKCLIVSLRAGRCVTIIWFLFGMRPYHTNTRFRLLFLKFLNEQLFSASDVI